MSLLFGSTGKLGILTNAGPAGATSGLVNRKYWDVVAATGIAIETTDVPPGNDACYSFPAAIVASANLNRVINDNTVCFGFWFKKVGATNPTTVNPRIIGTTTSNHTVRLTTGGILQIGANGTGFQNIITPVADVWYWITGRINTSGGTHTIDAQAYSGYDGSLIATATQSTAVLAATAQLNFVVGTASSMGGASMLIGCIVLDDDVANYPLLPHAGEVLAPNATGTHSFTAGNFVDDTGSNLATNETASWSRVDDWPANTTDWIRQNVDNANGYLEYDFEPTATGRFASIRGIQYVIAHLPSTTGANLVGWKLNDGGTITAEATIDVSTANALEYGMHTYQVRPNGGTAWTLAATDALKGRFGYMTLQPAQAGMSAMAVEVFGAYSFPALDIPAFGSVVAGSGASSASVVVPKPTGLAAGDLWVAIFSVQSATAVVSGVPSGWSTPIYGRSSEGESLVFSTKLADAGDVAGSGATFTMDIASTWHALGARYTGTNPAVDAVLMKDEAASSNNHTSAALAPNSSPTLEGLAVMTGSGTATLTVGAVAVRYNASLQSKPMALGDTAKGDTASVTEAWTTSSGQTGSSVIFYLENVAGGGAVVPGPPVGAQVM